MTKLNLTKPIVFFDLETTGTNVSSDRIIEISLIKMHINGETEIKTMRVNPEMPIPYESTKVHGIKDEDVRDQPTFKQVAKLLSQFIDNSDLAGYNSNKFDVPVLVEEFLRADVDFDIKGRRLLDVQNIFHFMEQRTLSAAYKFYCQKDMTNAHSAEYDAQVTLEVLLAQLEKYKDIELLNDKGEKYKPITNDVQQLSELTTRWNYADLAGRIAFNENGEEVFNFGKYKDKKVKDVFAKDPSYYNWIMQGEFPLYTKKIITKIRLSMK